jgi:hypothetical protein
MEKRFIRLDKFGGGESQFDRVASVEGSFLRGSQLDYRTDPSSLSINKNEVGTSLPTTVDLTKWMVPGGLTTEALFTLDSSGWIKKRSVTGVWSDFTSHASSAGQGLGYWRGDDFLYFTNYGQVGRYGPLAGTPTYQPVWQSINIDNDFHPIKEFRDFQAFGNTRYVSTWDATTWDVDRLILPSGWRVRSLEPWNEYLAVGCWRGSRVDSDNKGIIFFWDGISTTYNFFIETKGAVQAMKTRGSDLFMLLGPRAELWKYNGNLSKISNFPGVLQFNDVVNVNPGAIAERDGLIMMGVGANTSLSSTAKGVYSFGSNNPSLPETFNMEFLANGDTDTTMVDSQYNRIGALVEVQGKLFYSTYHPTATGLPVIVEVDGNTPFDTARGGRYESLIINDGEPHRIKRSMKFIANFAPLPTGVTMTFYYRADGGAWTTIGSTSNVGEVEYELTTDPIPFDFREVQLGATFNQSESDPQPKLYSMILAFEPEPVL